MNKFLLKNTESLEGKVVAVTGTTGGIGEQLCRYLLSLNATLVCVNRSRDKTKKQIEALKSEFSKAKIFFVCADLSDFSSVKSATNELIKLDIDIFIHNAGVYHVPRFITDIGYDNIFTVNFISPYYMIRKLLPILRQKGGNFVVTGSIAHRYSKTDAEDIDFRTRKKSSLVYGNAKRYLMFSLYELFKREEYDGLSIVHPGITFTGITNHYPKLIFALIKYPMKVIFMKPKKACLSTVLGIFKSTPYLCWIGPRFFDIWGLPKLRKLKISRTECESIGNTAERIYEEIAYEQNKECKTVSL